MIMERFELSLGRIREIIGEALVQQEYADYFKVVAEYICLVTDTCHEISSGKYEEWSLAEKQKNNALLYEQILPKQYEKGYLNPAYCVERYGEEMGLFLSALFAELQSLTAYCFEQDYFSMTIRMELFLEIYGLFVLCFDETKTPPRVAELKDIYASFAFDYQDEFMLSAVKSNFTLEQSFARDIVCNSDLTKPDYLYRYGEYITENELKMSAFLNGLEEGEIIRIADTLSLIHI